MTLQENRSGTEGKIRHSVTERRLENELAATRATLQDKIDQLQNLNAELKAAEKRTRHLASFPQVNPSPVLEVAASGRVTYFNPATQAILAALGMDKGNIAAFLPADMNAILHDLNKKENSTLFREIPVGDRIFAATVHLVPQFDVVRIYAFDITERKRAEEEVKKLNADLNNSVLQLEAANRELEAFSYSVSHDLRSPLRSVAGFSQALREDYEDRLDADGRDCLDRILAGTQLMGQLIDDLLNLSRVTRTEMQQKRVNLSEVAAKIATSLKNSEPERRVDFIIPPDIIASGDTHLLHLVLVNLFGNAFKFTARQEAALIEFGVTEQDCGKVYFVRDNGAGFDMTYSGKLFQPFQRLHSLGEFSGTGIGLATVRRIIDRHGGRTWIEGEPEKGATVYFTLTEQAGEQSA